jgi:hypothetical protein
MLTVILISCSLASPEFNQSRRAKTLVKARGKWEIGIIRANEGGRALREALLLKLLKESLTHTLSVSLMMLQLMMLQLGN